MQEPHTFVANAGAFSDTFPIPGLLPSVIYVPAHREPMKWQRRNVDRRFFLPSTKKGGVAFGTLSLPAIFRVFSFFRFQRYCCRPRRCRPNRRTADDGVPEADVASCVWRQLAAVLGSSIRGMRFEFPRICFGGRVSSSSG